MPKILDNVKERAVAEARRVMVEEGYEGLTIRKVAAALDVAVGTLYNYFPSKDFLIASVMLEDWQEIMQRLLEEGPAEDGITQIRRVFEGIKEFSDRYSRVWSQYSGQSVRSEETIYHAQLIAQIRRLLDSAVSEETAAADPYRREFLAENVLRFASNGHTEFSHLEGSLRRLIQ